MADRITAKVENTARIYGEINQFLKDMIDHVDPNCDYAIVDAKLVEQLIGLELTDTSKVGNFIRYEYETNFMLSVINLSYLT